MTLSEQDRLFQLITILESNPATRLYVAKELRKLALRYEDAPFVGDDETRIYREVV